jgi:putative nucleotidyltransferase with HDIG domain
MRWIDSKTLKAGMIIAKNIIAGDIILKKDEIVDQNTVEKIKGSHLLWVPIKMKRLSSELKVSTYKLEEDLEVKLEVLDILNCDVSIVEDIKNETKKVIEDIRSGKEINHKEVLREASKYIDEIFKDRSVLTYPLIVAKSYDAYTYSHLINVATLTAFLAYHMRFGMERVKNAYVGGLYHDIGKIEIPDNIIKKPFKLSEEEYEIIKTHPEKGLDIVSKFRNLEDPNDDIKNIVFKHHERINGNGYPGKLTSERIPVMSKIASVVDVYDALTSNRPYRKPMKPYEASRYILQRSGLEFDPKIVECFIKYIGIYPVGSKIKLNSEEIGTVVAINDCCTLRPIIRVENRIIDLSQKKELFIYSLAE